MSLTETAALVTVDKEVAREALLAYRNAKAPATDEDRAIMRAYGQISRGRIIVQACESVRQAGRDGKGLPKLALIRADCRRVHCRTNQTEVEFTEASKWGGSSYTACLKVDRMPPHINALDGVAIVPLIPLQHRPKAALSNYHILFEADWTRAPVDPLLLRRLKGDLWLVLAAWELTAVERAVLEQRVNS
jgi:hypothetical protein